MVHPSTRMGKLPSIQPDALPVVPDACKMDGGFVRGGWMVGMVGDDS